MKKREKRISSRSLYTILSIFVIILAGVVVSSVWSNPAVSHDSINVKVTIGGVDYSLQEAINLNKMGVDWSQSISSILAQDLTISGNAVFNNAVEFTGGLWSEAGTLSAYEISADNYMSSPKIVSNEFCVGPDYATADCITEWPAGGTATLPSEASFLGLTIGGGTQVDAATVFDGYLQNFYMGVEQWYSSFYLGRGSNIDEDPVIIIPKGANSAYYSNTGTIADGRVWCSGGLTVVTSTAFQCDDPKVYFYDGSDNVWEKRYVYKTTNNLNAVCLALGGSYSAAPDGVFGYLDWLADIGDSNNWGRIASLNKRAIDWVECNVLAGA